MNDILKKLPKKARYNMLAADIIVAVVILAILFLVRNVLSSFETLPSIILKIADGILIIAMVLQVLDIILTQIVGYNKVKYLISESSVEINSGYLFCKSEIVPIRRIQQVDIMQGPLNKLFGLATITVITGGGEVELEYIELEEARQLTDVLKARVNDFIKNNDTDILFHQPKEVSNDR